MVLLYLTYSLLMTLYFLHMQTWIKLGLFNLVWMSSVKLQEKKWTRTRHCYSAPETYTLIVAAELSRESDFKLVPDLGNYLGIPLHHGRVNRSSYHFLEDKLKICLNKWKSNFLSLAGQITLTKYVLNTIPVYYMQTNLLPNKTCEEIDKISRHFIWGCIDEMKRNPSYSLG